MGKFIATTLVSCFGSKSLNFNCGFPEKEIKARFSKTNRVLQYHNWIKN